MRFELTDDQRDLERALEGLLASSDTVAVARAWADDDTGPGLGLWKRLADLGVTMLATEATPVTAAAVAIQRARDFPWRMISSVPGRRPWLSGQRGVPSSV